MRYQIQNALPLLHKTQESMTRKCVSAVFDRKKMLKVKGTAKVELQIRLTRDCRKYVTLCELSALEWKKFEKSQELAFEIQKREDIVTAMRVLGEEMTLENLNKRLGIEETPKEAKKKEQPVKEEKTTFIDYVRDAVAKERIKEYTKQQKMVTLKALIDFGKIVDFDDLTPNNLIDFDAWLRADGTRGDTTIHNYHKRLKIYVRQVYERGLIPRNPYASVKFPRGRYKERTPLTEKELNLLRGLRVPPKEEKVRDLFIFAAYTGLAFCDVMLFDFAEMTVKSGDMYFINGARLKTGTNFYTPIFAPAMEVLEKYKYRLPRITNQKANDYLHLLESRANLKKPLTFHVAWHTFATISLAHDIPIENVARMLGHKDIRTTQLYAKVLKSTIERHATNLAKVFT